MKVDLEKDRVGWRMQAIDGERVVATSSGSSPKDAAKWLVRRLNRLADQTEEFLVDAGFLTDDEVEAARDLEAQP